MSISLNNLSFGTSKCGKGKKSIPTNKRLYNSIKSSVKKKAKVWPSAYASGQLVRQYKSRGGKYRCGFGSLDRWFKEKWVDVCRPKGRGYASCGRKKSSWNKYPYCRPSKRVNKSTPRTVGEIGKARIKKMCSQKRRNPRKKVFITNKNKMGSYKMNHFGNNLSRDTSNLTAFYRPGSINSINLTPGIRRYESIVYGDSILQNQYRFGKKKANFIQRANENSRKKGTVGTFQRWCRRRGFPKVNTACIKLGKRDKSLKTRRRAIFAQNIRSKKRHYSFGAVNQLDITKEKIDKMKDFYRTFELEYLRAEREINEQKFNKMVRIPGITPEQIEYFRISLLGIIDDVIREKEDEPEEIRITIKNLRNRETGLKPPRSPNFGKKRDVLTSEIKYLESIKCR